MVCRFSRVREKEIWQGCFLFCSDWGCFVFPVACCITSFSHGLVRLFFDWRVLPRGLWCVVWCFTRSASVLWMRVFSAASVSEEWLFWWVFECFWGVFVLFCLVLRGFLEFIADWILEKCMADKSGRFYVFCLRKRDSLGGFVRGCWGFYRATREGFSVVLENEILS